MAFAGKNAYSKPMKKNWLGINTRASSYYKFAFTARITACKPGSPSLREH
jgi:hypothetical protein